jgi:predicted transcriptional regulator
MDTLLISLHPRHSQNILSGKKTIELRKTKPRLREPGSILVSKKSLAFRNILIYQTTPTAEITGYCQAVDLCALPSCEWVQHLTDLCLSSEEIENYLGDRMGYGIRIRNPKRIMPIPLVTMREAGILPPQGYRYLSEEDINRLGVKFNG